MAQPPPVPQPEPDPNVHGVSKSDSASTDSAMKAHAIGSVEPESRFGIRAASNNKNAFRTLGSSSQARTTNSKSIIFIPHLSTETSRTLATGSPQSPASDYCLTPETATSVQRKLLGYGSHYRATSAATAAKRASSLSRENNSLLGVRDYPTAKGRIYPVSFSLKDKEDLHALIRSIINLLGAVLFTVGSCFFVWGNVLAGCIVFGAANILCYVVTGVWWATLAHRKVKAAKLTREADEYRDTVRPLSATISDDQPLPRVTTVAMGTNSPVTGYGYVSQAAAASAFRVASRIEIYAATWQILGAVCFTIGCGTNYIAGLETETLLFWLAGSFFFVLQSTLSQILCESFWGPLLPLWPRRTFDVRDLQHGVSAMGVGAGYRRLALHACIPGAFLNTLGSAAFTVGSVFLFYSATAWTGGVFYFVGSCSFVIAAAADIMGFVDAVRSSALENGTLPATPTLLLAPLLDGADSRQWDPSLPQSPNSSPARCNRNAATPANYSEFSTATGFPPMTQWFRG